MTEAEWLECEDPLALLRYQGLVISDRKLQLLAAACFRRQWESHVTDRIGRVINALEKMADTPATLPAFAAAVSNCVRSKKGRDSEFGYQFAVPSRSGDTPSLPPFDVALKAALVSRRNPSWRHLFVPLCHVSRHVFGNPFRVYPAPLSWPVNVVGLANARYDGLDNRLVLADALEEAGQLELADHFRQEEWHPKGCWVVDLILGKE